MESQTCCIVGTLGTVHDWKGGGGGREECLNKESHKPVLLLVHWGQTKRITNLVYYWYNRAGQSESQTCYMVGTLGRDGESHKPTVLLVHWGGTERVTDLMYCWYNGDSSKLGRGAGGGDIENNLLYCSYTGDSSRLEKAN